jgi:hypothetical protein
MMIDICSLLSDVQDFSARLGVQENTIFFGKMSLGCYAVSIYTPSR